MAAWKWLLGALGLGGLAAVALSGSSALAQGPGGPHPDDDDNEDTGGGGDDVGFPKQLYQAKAGDPQLEALLEELDAYLTNAGIDTAISSAREITRLPKATEVEYAIPPRQLWPRIVPTLKVFATLRQRLGRPLKLRAYRPPWYNAAVGGAKRSRHQLFEALDVYDTSGSSAGRRELALAGARLFLETPGPVGFGVYGPNSAPSDIHMDVAGRARRDVWEHGQYWIDKAGAVA